VNSLNGSVKAPAAGRIGDLEFGVWENAEPADLALSVGALLLRLHNRLNHGAVRRRFKACDDDHDAEH
jgi:hypothetical protein